MDRDRERDERLNGIVACSAVVAVQHVFVERHTLKIGFAT